MSGLVSMVQDNADLDDCAADEAYALWRDGYFVRDGRCWRFFTALGMLRVYCSFSGDAWESLGEMEPFRDVREVAAFLQNQYDSLSLC